MCAMNASDPAVKKLPKVKASPARAPVPEDWKTRTFIAPGTRTGKKFWKVKLYESPGLRYSWQVMLRWGASGTAGQMKEVGHQSHKAAVAYMNAAIQRKLDEGYTET